MPVSLDIFRVMVDHSSPGGRMQASRAEQRVGARLLEPGIEEDGRRPDEVHTIGPFRAVLCCVHLAAPAYRCRPAQACRVLISSTVEHWTLRNGSMHHPRDCLNCRKLLRILLYLASKVLSRMFQQQLI